MDTFDDSCQSAHCSFRFLIVVNVTNVAYFKLIARMLFKRQKVQISRGDSGALVIVLNLKYTVVSKKRYIYFQFRFSAKCSNWKHVELQIRIMLFLQLVYLLCQDFLLDKRVLIIRVPLCSANIRIR